MSTSQDLRQAQLNVCITQKRQLVPGERKKETATLMDCQTDDKRQSDTYSVCFWRLVIEAKCRIELSDTGLSAKENEKKFNCWKPFG